MACSSKRYLVDWLDDLQRWRGKCHNFLYQEVKNGCDAPLEWREGDRPGYNPRIISSEKDLAYLRGWKIMNPPNNLSAGAQANKWQPKNVRLSDAGVMYALLTLPKDYRIRNLAYDFDNKGDVREERVPKPPTVAVFQNNQRTLVTWKGVYVFTGGYNDAGWLLADNYPAGLPFFQAGLVITSSNVKTIDAFNVQLTEYQPQRLLPHVVDFAESPWKHGNRKYGILLKGCNDVWGHCLVLAGKTVSGYQKMGHLFRFHILIGPGAEPGNRNQAIQQDQVPSGTWKENWSPDVEFKQKPNDLINSIAIIWNATNRTNNIKPNTVEDATHQRKRKRQNIGNESEDPLPFQPYSSPSMRLANHRSADPPNDFSDNLGCFKRLWAELTTVESPPKHWDLFMAVGTMETMYESWSQHQMAVKIVQHNISPSEANIIRNLIQNLNSRLNALILGINSHDDCSALENAFSYNWSLSSFKQQIDVLEEGVVKQAYTNFYTYFLMLAFRNPDIPEPMLKLEQQEENHNSLLRQDRDQYTEIQGANSWSPCTNYTPVVQQTPIYDGYQDLLNIEENLYWQHGAVDLFHEKMGRFLGELRRDLPINSMHHDSFGQAQAPPRLNSVSHPHQRRVISTLTRVRMPADDRDESIA